MVALINGTTLEVNDTGEPVHVVDGGDSSYLCTETVSTNCCHRNFVFIHEPENVIGHLMKIVGVMVVRGTLIAVIEEPNVPDVSHAVIGPVEEPREILSWFEDVTQPNHVGHIVSAGR